MYIHMNNNNIQGGSVKDMEEKEYPSISMEKTGRWLKFICYYKKISVRQLLTWLGLGSPQSVYSWFCGRTLPSLDNFYAFSQALGLSLDALIVNHREFVPAGFSRTAGNGNARLFAYRLRFPLDDLSRKQ